MWPLGKCDHASYICSSLSLGWRSSRLEPHNGHMCASAPPQPSFHFTGATLKLLIQQFSINDTNITWHSLLAGLVAFHGPTKFNTTTMSTMSSCNGSKAQCSLGRYWKISNLAFILSWLLPLLLLVFDSSLRLQQTQRSQPRWTLFQTASTMIPFAFGTNRHPIVSSFLTWIVMAIYTALQKTLAP